MESWNNLVLFMYIYILMNQLFRNMTGIVANSTSSKPLRFGCTMWILTSSTCSYWDARIHGDKNLKSENTPLGTQMGNDSLNASSMMVVLIKFFNNLFSSISIIYDLVKKRPRQEGNNSKTTQLLWKGSSGVNCQLTDNFLIILNGNYNSVVTPCSNSFDISLLLMW